MNTPNQDLSVQEQRKIVNQALDSNRLEPLLKLTAPINGIDYSADVLNTLVADPDLLKLLAEVLSADESKQAKLLQKVFKIYKSKSGILGKLRKKINGLQVNELSAVSDISEVQRRTIGLMLVKKGINDTSRALKFSGQKIYGGYNIGKAGLGYVDQKSKDFLGTRKWVWAKRAALLCVLSGVTYYAHTPVKDYVNQLSAQNDGFDPETAKLIATAQKEEEKPRSSGEPGWLYQNTIGFFAETTEKSVSAFSSVSEDVHIEEMKNFNTTLKKIDHMRRTLVRALMQQLEKSHGVENLDNPGELRLLENITVVGSNGALDIRNGLIDIEELLNGLLHGSNENISERGKTIDGYDNGQNRETRQGLLDLFEDIKKLRSALEVDRSRFTDTTSDEEKKLQSQKEVNLKKFYNRLVMAVTNTQAFISYINTVQSFRGGAYNLIFDARHIKDAYGEGNRGYRHMHSSKINTETGAGIPSPLFEVKTKSEKNGPINIDPTLTSLLFMDIERYKEQRKILPIPGDNRISRLIHASSRDTPQEGDSSQDIFVENGELADSKDKLELIDENSNGPVPTLDSLAEKGTYTPKLESPPSDLINVDSAYEEQGTLIQPVNIDGVANWRSGLADQTGLITKKD